MKPETRTRLIEVASGRQAADLVLVGATVVDVGCGRLISADIAIVDGLIAGIGAYEGRVQINAHGLYALPGLIDAHIHIESSYVTPEELSRLVTPCGTTTIVADPHEIVNVMGAEGFAYMKRAAANAPLHVVWMIPSCVPATPFEHAGATLDADDLDVLLRDPTILGLGEMMNYPGVVGRDPAVLAKLWAAERHGKIIDGHSPGLTGRPLAAYAAAGVASDHECQTADALRERLTNGMIVQLREGSACHDLAALLPAVTAQNARRLVFCSDDRQPKTILEHGHIDDHMRRAVASGLDPIIVVQMATLNAAEAYGLSDRGALFPGRRADITLVDSLTDFHAVRVFIDGVEVARNGTSLVPVVRADDHAMRRSVHVGHWSREALKLHLTTPHVHTIALTPGGVVTKKGMATITLDDHGDWVYRRDQDLVKLVVIERHHNTGNVAVGFLSGYGLTRGAIAMTIAHDSHNIIAAGVSNDAIGLAVERLMSQDGGVVLVDDNDVLATLPFPIAGLMSDREGTWVATELERLHTLAHDALGVAPDVDPMMTLSFMALPVIPEVKLTDSGLFDVVNWSFLPLTVPETSVPGHTSHRSGVSLTRPDEPI